MDRGRVIRELFEEIDATVAEANGFGGSLAQMGAALSSSNVSIRDTSEQLMARLSASPADAFAGATPYLTMLGQHLGGWSLVRQSIAAQRRIDAGDDDARLAAKIVTSSFYCDQLLPLGAARAHAVLGDAEALTALTPEQFVS